MSGPRCPVHDRACSTAYNRYSCRCEVCKRWNAGHSKRVRKNPSGRRYLNTARMRELWQAADQAFREDPAYARAMALDHYRLSDN